MITVSINIMFLGYAYCCCLVISFFGSPMQVIYSHNTNKHVKIPNEICRLGSEIRKLQEKLQREHEKFSNMVNKYQKELDEMFLVSTYMYPMCTHEPNIKTLIWNSELYIYIT